MPSMSPSPVKRPSMAERSSSTHSLSSQGKQQQQQQQHAQQKVHRVTRHSRNVSHGKALNKLGKINSTTNITTDGRNHARKKSGPTTPGPSPKTPTSTSHMKRNSSQANLIKNTSYGNLRKNHSAKELAAARNAVQGNAKKLGAPPAQKAVESNKQGFFVGNASSEEEDEGEWEDSTATHSPELSRNHSKTSTPLRSRTPIGDGENKVAGAEPSMLRRNISPPEASLKTVNRSAPNLRDSQHLESKPTDPALLQGHPRASRAPPAMSTVSAHVKRNDSVRSIANKASQQGANGSRATAGTSGGVGASSSGSHGVSHFLPSTSVATSGKSAGEEDEERRDNSVHDYDNEEDDTTGFMSNYKPQPSQSPENAKMLNKARTSALPSRTQQKLELQRRETMRVSAAAATASSTPGLGLSMSSTASLHSRSGSKGRNRSSIVGDPKILRQDYEAGIKHLTVVRRFRNPILDSLHRLQDAHMIPSSTSSMSQSKNVMAATSSGLGGSKSRPQSRRGFNANISATGTPKSALARSPQDKKTVQPYTSRPSSSRSHHHQYNNPNNTTNSTATTTTTTPKVQFQMSRQASHEDMLTAPTPTTTTSERNPSSQAFGHHSDSTDDDDNEDEDEDDGGDGIVRSVNGRVHGGGVASSGSGPESMSLEEALIRRIWESRVVFENDGVQS